MAFPFKKPENPQSVGQSGLQNLGSESEDPHRVHAAFMGAADVAQLSWQAASDTDWDSGGLDCARRF